MPIGASELYFSVSRSQPMLQLSGHHFVAYSSFFDVLLSIGALGALHKYSLLAAASDSLGPFDLLVHAS